ncbi:MAG: N-formylglutamate deformylase [Woeseia sp.]|nr:N-formylglutamate deformylase [Woeseia sp.]MBT8097857.1 N-formylglutamate deformylase [Woeseia sp.]NNL55839.1 N-formylglutamate deformylase [Woeseia sp.]
MTGAVFEFHQGSSPLLISVPHDGRELPDDIAARMTPVALTLPDTDWHVAELYAFAREQGASMITARYSRYVVDLNRPPDDAALYAGKPASGICPSKTFGGEALYTDGDPINAAEQDARINRYWRPYHAEIAAVLSQTRRKHGYALLWDAHSIASRVPQLFDGELPVLNIGTNRGASCAPAIESELVRYASQSQYSSVCNGRFTGGYITRYFGKPKQKMHAVQLELSQRSYMNETTLRYNRERSARLQRGLRGLLDTYIRAAETLHA